MKYKPTFYDLSQEGGVAKLKRDGFKRHEVMQAIHNNTRGMPAHEKRAFVREFVKSEK